MLKNLLAAVKRKPPGTSGASAERIAEDFLSRHGLTLLVRNHRCRLGEVDLIMRDSDTVVFVEVRLRRNVDYGGAAASIVKRKQRRVIAAAEHWLSRYAEQPPCRFDAVLLNDLSSGDVEWIRDAFTTDA